MKGQCGLDSAGSEDGAGAGYEYNHEHSDYIKSAQCINQLRNFSTVTPFQEGSWLGKVIKYIYNQAHKCHSLTDYKTPLSENLKGKRAGLFPEYTRTYIVQNCRLLSIKRFNI